MVGWDCNAGADWCVGPYLARVRKGGHMGPPHIGGQGKRCPDGAEPRGVAFRGGASERGKSPSEIPLSLRLCDSALKFFSLLLTPAPSAFSRSC